MFCPVCKTGYRPGLTKCSHCGVDLVSNLPAEEPGTGADVLTDSEGNELLWSGLSSKLCGRIRSALDAAGISHTYVEKEFGSLPAFRQNAQLVWINPRFHDAARSVVARVLAEIRAAAQRSRDVSADRANTYSVWPRRGIFGALDDREPWENEYALFPPDGPAERPTPDDIFDDFHPEDATSEVWAGEDIEMAQFLKDSLRGVGIGCVVSEDGGTGRVLVLPADESRAREIVREVVEGAPPQ
jgi:hypothetical protein